MFVNLPGRHFSKRFLAFCCGVTALSDKLTAHGYKVKSIS